MSTLSRTPAKILVLADLHYDHWEADPFEGCEDLLEGVSAVILAGDAAQFAQWSDAFAYVREKVNPLLTFVIPGNHDYYGFFLDGEGTMAEHADQHGGDFLQKDRIVFNDTRFLCCTLWSDFKLGGEFEENKRRARRHMSDFHYIGIYPLSGQCSFQSAAALGGR